jgi:hypothetical protein
LKKKFGIQSPVRFTVPKQGPLDLKDLPTKNKYIIELFCQ